MQSTRIFPGSARVSRVCQSGSDFRRLAETIFERVRERETASPTREVRAGLALRARPGIAISDLPSTIFNLRFSSGA